MLLGIAIRPQGSQGGEFPADYAEKARRLR
jgi:hypothetical protein